MKKTIIITIGVALLAFIVIQLGCRKHKETTPQDEVDASVDPNKPVENPEFTVLDRSWSSVTTSEIGRTRTEVGNSLGFATCGDSYSDEIKYPGEEIVTFSHDGFDYRVHFREDDVVRAFKAKILWPSQSDAGEN